MYDKTGNIIYEIQTSIDKSGYPMDIALSNDGKKLFTSYFKMDGVNIKNNLTAYNFGEVGQNENADRMVGGYSFDEEMVPKVEFVTNDIVAAFSDSEILLYNMKEKPSERGSIKYGGEATSIFYCSEYLGYIAPDKKKENDTAYILHSYDLSGKKNFEYSGTAAGTDPARRGKIRGVWKETEGNQYWNTGRRSPCSWRCMMHLR